MTGGIQPGGHVELDLGANGGTNSRFAYYEPGSASPSQTQSLNEGSGCVLAAPDPNEPELMALSPTPDNGDVGLRQEGLGVKTRGPGENCAELSDREALRLQLGSFLDGKTISAAELDIEVTGECLVGVSWRDDTGNEIAFFEDDLKTRTDCGPNSSGSDNYSTVYEAPPGATGLTLSAGADSTVRLMGGAENPEVRTLGTTGSVFTLIVSDGILDCANQPNGQPSTYEEDGVTLQRIDVDPDCELVSFSLEFDGTDLEFGKDLSSQPLAEFLITVAWTDTLTDAAYPGRVTQIDYLDGVGYQDMEFCAGDATTPTLPRTDMIPSTAAADGWCVVSQDAEIGGVDGADQLIDTVNVLYGIGDPKMR